MLKLLKKTAFVSLGFAVLSAEAVKRMGEKIVEESKMSEEEGREFVNDLMVQSKESKKKLQDKVEEIVKNSIEKLHLPTSKDIESIDSRLSRIEKELGIATPSDLENNGVVPTEETAVNEQS